MLMERARTTLTGSMQERLIPTVKTLVWQTVSFCLQTTKIHKCSGVLVLRDETLLFLGFLFCFVFVPGSEDIITIGNY